MWQGVSYPVLCKRKKKPCSQPGMFFFKRFILRNYIAQNAIDAAEKGDFSEVRRVLEILQTPYSEDLDLESLTQTTAGVYSSKYSTKLEYKFLGKFLI